MYISIVFMHKNQYLFMPFLKPLKPGIRINDSNTAITG